MDLKRLIHCDWIDTNAMIEAMSFGDSGSSSLELPHYLLGLHGAGVADCRAVHGAFSALLDSAMRIIGENSTSTTDVTRLNAIRAISLVYAPFDAPMLLKSGVIDKACKLLVEAPSGEESPDAPLPSQQLRDGVAQFVTLLSWNSF